MAESRLEIAIDSRGAETNARSIRRELEGMERAGNTATRAARSTAGGFGQIARSSQLAVPPVGQLTALLGGLSGAMVARQVVAYSDAWQNAGNQLRQVTDSAEELAGTQERLMEVANTTRSDFGSTANLYSRLARSTTELGLSQSDLIGLTRTINQSFATSGATADEAAAAITQLSQGLAAGALRGDEFNSVSEQAPGIMRAIAESLDMTIGELRDFAAEGGITADIVVTALQDSADAIENDFGRAVATFGQNMTVARNNMLQFVGNSDSVEGGVANIGAAIVDLSENLDAVGQAATIAAGVLGGRLVGRLVAVTAGMTTAAGAATALRTALAFLGGPAGIAIAAATAMYAFREELGLVADPAGRARDSLDLLTTSIEDMTQASLDATMVQLNAKMFELEGQARAAREEIERLNGQSGGSGVLGFSSGQVSARAGAEANLGRVSGQQAEVQRQIDKVAALHEGLGAAGEAGDKAGESLRGLGDTADDLVAKFKPMLDQDIQSILDQAGDGSTIDETGTLRDAWGNALPTLQRELDAQLKDQLNTFKSEQNLQAGLEAAAQAFVDGATGAASQAWGSITPMSADDIARNQSRGGDGTEPSLMATKSQDSAPARAGKSMGTFTIKVAKEGEGDTEGTVQGDEDFIRRMASALGGVASAV